MNITEWGALAFGVVIGWYTYFVNRHRAEVKIADVASIIGAIGGGAVLALFPEQSRLFGFYGIGLAAGFFGYFLILVGMVLILRKQQDEDEKRKEAAAKAEAAEKKPEAAKKDLRSKWSLEWFLDGRRPALAPGQIGAEKETGHAMSLGGGSRTP